MTKLRTIPAGLLTWLLFAGTARASGVPASPADASDLGQTQHLVMMVVYAAVALVFGGEDKGLSDTLRSKCDRVVSIPLLGRISSLNISVAVAVVLYEKVRQQHAVSG